MKMQSVLKTSALLASALTVLADAAGCQKASTNAAAIPPPIAGNAAPQAGSSVVNRDATDAKAFLDGLYAHYKNSKNSTFQPFDENVREVLDADTIALMDADTKALKGEVGDIDGDWLCDCQDYESLTATITVQSATPTAAKATSVFHDKIDAGAAPKRDTFDLVETPAGWRIHDMGTADQPSLRRVLQDEIARLKAGGKPVSGD
jgi:hypothetical protein